MPSESKVPSYVIEINKEINKLATTQKELENRIEELETAHNELFDSVPSTAVLSKNVITRAFAIWGHTLLVSVIFYGIFFLLTLALAYGSR